jgi:hypothetical protein
MHGNISQEAEDSPTDKKKQINDKCSYINYDKK